MGLFNYCKIGNVKGAEMKPNQYGMNRNRSKKKRKKRVKGK